MLPKTLVWGRGFDAKSPAEGAAVEAIPSVPAGKGGAVVVVVLSFWALDPMLPNMLFWTGAVWTGAPVPKRPPEVAAVEAVFWAPKAKGLLGGAVVVVGVSLF